MEDQLPDGDRRRPTATERAPTSGGASRRRLAAISAQNTPAARAWVASGGPLRATANALRDAQAAAGGRIPDLARHLASGLMQQLRLYPEAYGRLVGEIESELRAP